MNEGFSMQSQVMDPDLSALRSRLEAAIAARLGMQDPRHEGALRLFNGFLEGYPDLAIDLYARTALIYNHTRQPELAQPAVQLAAAEVTRWLPWVQAVIVKSRFSGSDDLRRGVVLQNGPVDRKVRENGVWYALDLLHHSGPSLFLDTRNLRDWARQNLEAKSVLNTFAYTGSLGVAACAGGAHPVIHLDRNRDYLNLAKTSYVLNGFPIDRANFRTGDFFSQVSRLRREETLFDCIFLDPPFFSITDYGQVNLENNYDRLVNKVRPLVKDGGWLVVVNNALFVSGKDFLKSLEELSKDGYLSLETSIPVPADFTGFPDTCLGHPPVDPAPFNHSTKICVLRVRRKVRS